MSTEHVHAPYSHIDGIFRCACGAVRIAVGKWADPYQSREISKRAKRETDKMVYRHGTSVDGYGQRLPK